MTTTAADSSSADPAGNGGMSAGDAAACARVRDAVTAWRRAQHEVWAAVGALRDSTAAPASGHRSTARLVEELVRVDPAEAKRLLSRAERLTGQATLSGGPIPPTWPATAEAAADGEVGEEHLRVLAPVLDAVEGMPHVDAGTAAAAEATMAEAARRLAPCGVARVGQRLVAHLDPDGAAPVDPPVPHDELHFGTHRDGSLGVKGRFHEPADAELLREVFDALSQKAGPDDERTLETRRAAVLLELREQATREGGLARDEPGPATDRDEDADGADPTDGEPGHEGDTEPGRDTDPQPTAPNTGAAPGRPQVVVTIDYQWLRRQTGHSLLDTDTPLTGAAARRIACDAEIIPTLLGGRGQPLDIGRATRTVPDGMRRALHHRDRGCSFPGCTRRPRRCQAHHVIHWADGGPTRLDNLTLLCRYHHHLVHHRSWHLRMRAGKPEYRPPPGPTRPDDPDHPAPTSHHHASLPRERHRSRSAESSERPDPRRRARMPRRPAPAPRYAPRMARGIRR